MIVIGKIEWNRTKLYSSSTTKMDINLIEKQKKNNLFNVPLVHLYYFMFRLFIFGLIFCCRLKKEKSLNLRERKSRWECSWVWTDSEYEKHRSETKQSTESE